MMDMMHSDDLTSAIPVRVRLPDQRMDGLREIAAARGLSAEKLIIELLAENLRDTDCSLPDGEDSAYSKKLAQSGAGRRPMNRMPPALRLKLVRRKQFVYDGVGLIEQAPRNVDIKVGVPEPQMTKLREAAAREGSSVTAVIRRLIDQATENQ